MKKRSFGLSNFIYTEWLRPIFDYYVAIKKNEAVFEILIPGVIAVVASFLYSRAGKIEAALRALSDLLPTAISILIGFTVMLITLLLTSSGENIDRIKEIKTDKRLHNKEITLYQGLHIQFSHSLFSEIMLLLVVFFYLFLFGLGWNADLGPIFLAVEIYLIMNILLSILRGISNLYFSFYNVQK
jgi:hypothetical protein